MTAGNRLVGVATRSQSGKPELHRDPVVAYPGEPLRVIVYRMAETGRTTLPVINDPETRELLGVISLRDLLKARVRDLGEERTRERVLHIHWLRPELASK